MSRDFLFTPGQVLRYKKDHSLKVLVIEQANFGLNTMKYLIKRLDELDGEPRSWMKEDLEEVFEVNLPKFHNIWQDVNDE